MSNATKERHTHKYKIKQRMKTNMKSSVQFVKSHQHRSLCTK